MQEPNPALGTAALTLIQTSQHQQRLRHRAHRHGLEAVVPTSDVDSPPGPIWVTDAGSTIHLALAGMRLRGSVRETAVVVVAGEIDAASAPRLSAFISGVYFPYEVVRLDLERTVFADAALIRVLDTERVRRAPHCVGVEIVRASAVVRRVLESAGQDHYLIRDR